MELLVFNENKNNLLIYMLNSCESKLPIKSIELQKLINKDQINFKQCFETACKDMSEIYGVIVQQVPHSRNGKVWICYVENISASLLRYDLNQRRDMTLLFIILSFILLSNSEVEEDILFSFLHGLDINVDEKHEYFGGNLRKIITDTFIAQLYLHKTKVDKEFISTLKYKYSWGYRSLLEFDQTKMLETTAKMLGKPTNIFVTQNPVDTN